MFLLSIRFLSRKTIYVFEWYTVHSSLAVFASNLPHVPICPVKVSLSKILKNQVNVEHGDVDCINPPLRRLVTSCDCLHSEYLTASKSSQ